MNPFIEAETHNGANGGPRRFPAPADLAFRRAA